MRGGPEILFRLSYKGFASIRVFERIQVCTARSHQIVDFTTKIVSYVGLGSFLSRQGRDTGLRMRLRSFLHRCCFSKSFFFPPVLFKMRWRHSKWFFSMQVKTLQATFTRWEQLPPSATERIVLSKELLSSCESIEWQVRNHVAKVVGILRSMEG